MLLIPVRRAQKSPSGRGAHTRKYTAISSDRRHGLGCEGPLHAHDEDAERIVSQLGAYWQWPQRFVKAWQWLKTLPPPSTSRALSVGGTDAPTRDAAPRRGVKPPRAPTGTVHRAGMDTQAQHLPTPALPSVGRRRRVPAIRRPFWLGPSAQRMRAPMGMGQARSGHCHVFATPPRMADSARDRVSSSPSRCPTPRPRPHLVVSGLGWWGPLLKSPAPSKLELNHPACL